MLRQSIVLIQRLSARGAVLLVLLQYKNYANVFLEKDIATLLELSSAKHAIKTIADLPFRLLYNLFTVQLKAL
jgi:hypothetical protein